jgi:hypothetical protein
MDFETISAREFGASLRGMGINILVRDVPAQAARLAAIFGMQPRRVSADFAILLYGEAIFQLHADHTYRANPLIGLLPEQPPRGTGIELRLYDSDPDLAVRDADAHGFTILAAPSDKPHGLREAYLLCPDGYAWVPSRPL